MSRRETIVDNGDAQLTPKFQEAQQEAKEDLMSKALARTKEQEHKRISVQESTQKMQAPPPAEADGRGNTKVVARFRPMSNYEGTFKVDN